MSERDSRLGLLAELARRAGWRASRGPGPRGAWLRLEPPGDAVSASVYSSGVRLSCLATVSVSRSGGPLEALRAAYAALGVALEQAEESGLGRFETPAQDSDA